MSTSPIRQIIEGSVRNQGVNIDSTVEPILDAVTADLEENLRAIIDAASTYMTEQGIDASEQTRLFENVGLGGYVHPVEEEPEVEDEPASDDDRIDLLERNLAGVVEAVAGLTSIAERYLVSRR